MSQALIQCIRSTNIGALTKIIPLIKGKGDYRHRTDLLIKERERITQALKEIKQCL